MGKPHHTKWDERATAAANARRELPALVAAYFAHARKVLAKNPSPPRLHRLRLASKQLRYTLELFRPCCGPGLEARLAVLRQIQQMLGDVNDTVAAERMLAKAISNKSAQSLRIQRFLKQRAAQKSREFRKNWTEVFDAPGQEQWWTSYLARSVRTKSRR
jgi:CHAD domain-containing protein